MNKSRNASLGIAGFFLFSFVFSIVCLHEQGIWIPAAVLEFLIFLQCLSRKYSLEQAFAAAVTLFLGGATLWIHLSRYLLGTYEEKLIVSMAIVFSLLFCWFVYLGRGPLQPHRYLSPRKGAVWLTLGFFIAFLLIIWSKQSASFAWAMREDSVWNTVTARFMLTDEGFNPTVHPHSSPLTAALMAGVMSFGRGKVPATELLQVDLAHVGELWLILTFIISVAFLLIGSKFIPSSNKKSQFFVAVICGIYPWTWLISGWAFQLGYLNATLSLVILATTWILWINSELTPVFTSICLAMSVVSQLATWAPLALLPLGLLLLHFWKLIRRLTFRKFPQNINVHKYSIISGLSAISLVVVYLVFVSFADLSREKSALSYDGGMFNFRIWSFLIPSLVLLLFCIYLRKKFPQFNSFTEGALIIVLCSFLALAYLIFQRRDSATLWGYYPAKMSWIASSILVIITISFVAGIFFRSFNQGKIRTFAFIATTALACSLVLVSPPSKQDFFTPLNILLSSGVAENGPQVSLLSKLAGQQNQQVVFQFANQNADKFMNLWLLQIKSKSGESPLRQYAYYLDPSSVQDLCEIDRLSKVPVSVLTRSLDLQKKLQTTCPQNNISLVGDVSDLN